MNEINSFTFYKDYFNLIDTIPLKDKKDLLVGIVDYVFKDKEPLFDGHNQAIFNTLKSQLNKSKYNSERRTKKEPNENRMKTETKPKREPKENKTSILCFMFLISNFKLLDKGLLREKIEEWVKYKDERKEYYKETGLKSLLTEIENNVKKYGEDAVINLITNCMASNYKGIIFEKLEKEYKPLPSWYGKEIKSDKYEYTEDELREIEAIKNGNYGKTTN